MYDKKQNKYGDLVIAHHGNSDYIRFVDSSDHAKDKSFLYTRDGFLRSRSVYLKNRPDILLEYFNDNGSGWDVSMNNCFEEYGSMIFPNNDSQLFEMATPFFRGTCCLS